MLRSLSLPRVAFWAFVLPCIVALVSQLLIMAIPGCNPNPYSAGSCVVFSHNLAVPLLAGLFGGIWVAIVAAVFVSLPLLLIAIILRLLGRRSSGNVA
jgi:hypothetical protein